MHNIHRYIYLKTIIRNLQITYVFISDNVECIKYRKKHEIHTQNEHTKNEIFKSHYFHSTFRIAIFRMFKKIIMIKSFKFDVFIIDFKSSTLSRTRIVILRKYLLNNHKISMCFVICIHFNRN